MVKKVSDPIERAKIKLDSILGYKQKFLNILIRGCKEKKKLVLGIGNESYNTEGIIQVQVSESDIQELPWKVIENVAIDFLIGHEAGHSLYTTHEGFGGTIKEMAKWVEDEGKKEFKSYPMQSIFTICHFIVNSVEDGRIEKILSLRSEDFRKKKDWYNLRNWKKGECPDVGTMKELFVFQNQVLCYSILGRFQKKFTAKYKGSDLYKNVLKTKKYIRKAVNSPTCIGIREQCMEILKIMYPYIKQDIPSLSPEELDFLKSLAKWLEKEGANISRKDDGDGKGGVVPESMTKESKSEEKAELEDDIENSEIEENSNKIENSLSKDDDSKRNQPKNFDMKMIENIEKYYEDDVITDYEIVTGDRRQKSLVNDKKKLEANRFKRFVERTIKQRSTMNRFDQYSGNVNTSQLYKLATGQPNFYQQKGQPYIPDARVFILVDNSGSMRGEKFNEALLATSVMEHGFNGVVPLKIVSFGTNDYHVSHKIVKDWNETSRTINYSETYRLNNYANGGNKDGYSIRMATAELESFSEGKKLLIVLSDGAPTDYKTNAFGYADTHNAVACARKKGISVISVFFGGESYIKEAKSTYEALYEKDFIGVSPNKIQDELQKILKRVL